MWVGRLVNLIEDHADELTGRLVRTVREDPRTIGYRQFDDKELGARAREVYSHLGQWLGKTSEGAVESEYFRLGKIRRAEGIPLSEVVMALLLVRRNLWQFVESQGADSSLTSSCSWFVSSTGPFSTRCGGMSQGADGAS